MKIDEQFFRDILEIDSTSGKERALSDWLEKRLAGFAERMESFEVGDGTRNLFLSWGTPKIVYCTHMDTVPPYIVPRFGEEMVTGRGSCDAKGQIYAILRTAEKLSGEGKTDFGVLLVSGEETGSFGAKAFAKLPFSAPWLVIGEPTENKMVEASKGTKAFAVHFTGKAFHSGYPEMGQSAVDMFVHFISLLKRRRFLDDPLLGETTWNVGRLVSDNPQNILSPSLDCRIYFRTTFTSDAEVTRWMMRKRPGIKVEALGGDTPAHYYTVPKLKTTVVSFGSDAPHLSNFEHRMICGPGSIKVAHRDNEYVKKADIEHAIEAYSLIYEHCQKVAE